MNRLTTGTEALDLILGGGFPDNSMNLIVGMPGTGKTVLAESIAFRNASAESPALFISTVSEPLDKMLRYVQEFDFFDPAMVGEAIAYEDLNYTLRTGGLAAAIAYVIELIKTLKPSFLIIDSFKALHAFEGTPSEFRKNLAELASVLSVMPVTAFLIGEYSSDEISEMPEFAVADSIIELVLRQVGVKDQRYLRVVKLRGSDFFAGEHAFKITRSGLSIFPRLTTPMQFAGYETQDERSATGVQLLDDMISEGFWRGSSTVVFGPPGGGKTLIGLHFLFAGIARGEKALIATMEENPIQLARIAKGFGWDLQGAIDRGMLDLMYVSPVDLYIDEFTSVVAERALKGNVSRVLIDSLNDLQVASPNPLRFRDFMYSLVQLTAVNGVSLLMTQEVGDIFASSVYSEFGISHMSDNVLLLRYADQATEIRRTIAVVKTRASSHDPRVREFTIDSQGLRIVEA